jgi:hypothetical protein
VKDESEIFEKSNMDSGYLDNFEVAWRGCNFLLDLRQKVIDGEATIFPE